MLARWSFGILLYEIVMLGSGPYPTLFSTQELLTFLQSGDRMGKPEHCSQELYKVMKSCWSQNHFDRPSFEDLSKKMSNLLKLENVGEGPFIDLQMLYDKFCDKNKRQSTSVM